MSTVKRGIEIVAPIETVWDTLMDPGRLADWVTIHKSVGEVSDSPLRKGSTMRQAMHVRGFTFHVNWTLVALDKPRHAEWKGVGPAHSQARIRYELTSLDDNRTRFEYTNEFHPPGGRLGHVASRMIVGATSEREADRSLNKLKALLERG
jgi:carbon monoxide dehydrogenase subunit G